MTYFTAWTGKRCHMNVRQVFFKEPCGKSDKKTTSVALYNVVTLVTILVFSTDI